MSRTGVRAGRMAAVAVTAALVVALAGRAAGGPPADPPGGGPRSGAEAPGTRYVVRPGDTLWHIARARVGPRADPRPMVQELREANGLDTAMLRPGTTLLLPPAP